MSEVMSNTVMHDCVTVTYYCQINVDLLCRGQVLIA